jgi:hypothetical protein
MRPSDSARLSPPRPGNTEAVTLSQGGLGDSDLAKINLLLNRNFLTAFFNVFMNLEKWGFSDARPSESGFKSSSGLTINGLSNHLQVKSHKMSVLMVVLT